MLSAGGSFNDRIGRTSGGVGILRVRGGGGGVEDTRGTGGRGGGAAQPERGGEALGRCGGVVVGEGARPEIAAGSGGGGAGTGAGRGGGGGPRGGFAEEGTGAGTEPA